MRKGFLAALTAILAGHGLAVAQSGTSNLPGHAWQPRGQPPSPPTMVRTWTPPPPVLPAPVSPQPGPQPAGMAGWPPPRDLSAVPLAPTSAPQSVPTAIESPYSSGPATQPVAASGAAAPPPGLFDPGLGAALSEGPYSDLPAPPGVYSMPPEDGPPAGDAPHGKGKLNRPFGCWGSAEYLMWWFKDGRVPPLVTAGGTGVPGAPGTTVELENLDFANDFRHGGRFAVGYQCKRVPYLGFEADYLFIADQEDEVGFASAGTPVLARPFLNATTGALDASLIAAPGTAGGTILVGARTWLWSVDGNVAVGVIANDVFHIAALGGFRYFYLEDEVKIREQFTASSAVPIFGGSTVGIEDSFRTANHFYGGQLGVDAGVRVSKLTVDFRGKVALGNMHQIAYVTGATGVLGPDGMAPLPGGLLGLPTNSGRHSRDELAFIPEVGLNFGLQVTRCLKLTVGYTFLYVNNVIRAGDQIDPVINVTQLPTASGPGALVGVPRPMFQFHDNDFWAQGLNFGLELRY